MEFSKNEIEFSLAERAKEIEKIACLLVSHLDTYKTDINSLYEEITKIKNLRKEYDLLMVTYKRGISGDSKNIELFDLIHDIDSRHDEKIRKILNEKA